MIDAYREFLISKRDPGSLYDLNNELPACAMNDFDTKQLSELITRKLQCLRQLCELGRRQLELISAGDMTQLFRVLSAKQHMIGAVQEIEKALEPFRRQDPDSRNWPSEEDRARCAQQARLCEQMLQEVMRQEQQAETQLTARRDQVARQLQDAQKAGQARGAYCAEQPSAGPMLDLTSGS